MAQAIDGVELAYATLSAGETVLPLRTNMPVAAHQGSLLAMPGFVGGGVDGLGVKLVTLYGENPSRYNLPAIQGIFVLFDPANGQLAAIMEAGLLTAVRTGAATGVSVRHLALPDAETLTLFGTGGQAPYQIEAVLAERPIRRVWVLSRQWERAQAFARQMSEQFGLPVTPTQDGERAVKEAQIIVTATSSHDPLFPGEWLQPGTHISGVGSHLATAREVDSAAIQRSRVFTDQTSACLAESGDIVIPIQEGALREADLTEIGLVIRGEAPGRANPQEITFFKSVGLAAQDVAVAAGIAQRARESGAGQFL
jgi:ornithine cyclodeaminase